MEEENKKDHEEHTKEPDEQSGVYIESFIKIYDPIKEEVYLEQRA